MTFMMFIIIMNFNKRQFLQSLSLFMLSFMPHTVKIHSILKIFFSSALSPNNLAITVKGNFLLRFPKIKNFSPKSRLKMDEEEN